RPQIRELAAIIKSVLSGVQTLRVWVPAGEERCRGRIREGVLESAAERVRAVVDELPYPPKPEPPVRLSAPPVHQDRAAWLLRGDKVTLALDQMLTCPVAPLGVGEAAAGRMLRHDGSVVDEVAIVKLGSNGREERFALLTTVENSDAAAARVAALSDGYLLFDERDLYAKIDGPTVIEPLPDDLLDRLPESLPEPATDVTKPYFIGQPAEYARAKPEPKPDYAYEEPDLPVRPTVLNQAHKELGGKMVPFAGWEMPVQYPDGILAEHAAVRTAAGLFDVSHMSLFEVSGKHAVAFLDTLLANCVSRLDPGQAQYTYLLYPDGTALDDLYIYRLAPDRFMIVANAANAERDWDWINAVNAHEVVIDEELPARQIELPVEVRNLRDDGLVGLALQGPASATLLARLADRTADRFAIDRLEQNRFIDAVIAGIPCTVAATGYTGEAVGFELYIHPDRCVELWGNLLEAGEALGVRPAGLGARDSTRTEAGFPLFGHELEGPSGLSITEAGYGFVARFHVPFFIGRRAYIDRVRNARQTVIRLRGRGRRSVRPGHPIIDADDTPVGQVTSFAYTRPDFTFFALAAVASSLNIQPGDRVRAVRHNIDRYEPPPKENAVVELDVLTRFPEDEERASWPELYA
ncbi:MAG: glycine cleavage system aminomethyltransferase GcvT, partial [Planctomycetota bacterium]